MIDKDLILKLRQDGKTYKQIAEQIGCAHSTIYYYCVSKAKEKALERQKIRRGLSLKMKPIRGPLPKFISDKVRRFISGKRTKKFNLQRGNFNAIDFYNKFGQYTKCYLTGREINLFEKGTYEFDHIVPISKGGTNNLDNLGILCKNANYAKSNLSISEFLDLCKEVIAFNTLQKE